MFISFLFYKAIVIERDFAIKEEKGGKEMQFVRNYRPNNTPYIEESLVKII